MKPRIEKKLSKKLHAILGNLLGSHFALKKGARFIRPMMLVVLVLLLGKLISDAVL